jgi:hypothetical protein
VENRRCGNWTISSFEIVVISHIKQYWQFLGTLFFQKKWKQKQQHNSAREGLGKPGILQKLSDIFNGQSSQWCAKSELQ